VKEAVVIPATALFFLIIQHLSRVCISIIRHSSFLCIMEAIKKLFGTEYPVVAGGMVWCSGWRLASAVSNAGGLGLIGAGSMHPPTLLEHIRKAKAATDKPFGVNVPLLYPEQEAIMDIIVSEGVKIVFTSAGSPKKWTSFLHDHGITVAHVVSSAAFAEKSEAAGVDAIVAEGFEAGGHEGREETTTMALIPSVRRATSLPLLAAGGIGSGEQMYAAMALGADGVQIGSLFAASQESSAHEAFKQKVIETGEGGTMLTLKQLAPVRLIRNQFFEEVEKAQLRGANVDELRELLGKGRARKGIFEGELNEGELEIGQVASLIKEIKPVSEIMQGLLDKYRAVYRRMASLEIQ
jgi:enoyl-[acyl-carrier protein] reductase II